MSQACNQREHLTLPIIAFSFSTGANHAGKPLWTHLNGGANSFLTFETLTERNATDGSITKRPVIKVIYDGRVHEQISLDHLVRLAQIDEKSGNTGNEKEAKLNLVIKKPMMAMKYTTEDFDTRRFQVKFLPHPDTGFNTACERLRLYGLRLKDHGDEKQIGQLSASQSTIAAGGTQNTQAPQTAHIQLPTYQNPETNPLPIASTQTQGQRVANYNTISQESQPQSIPLHNYEYQSQPRYNTLFHPNGRSTGLPNIPEHFEYLPTEHVPKQAFSDTTLPRLPNTPLNRLTDKPVERKLSFSTPPSSNQQLDLYSQEIYTGQRALQGSDMYAHMPPPLAPQKSSTRLQPSLLPQASREGPVSDRRPFFQQSSPLKNELTFRTSVQLAHDMFSNEIVSNATPEPAWRPATAPAYPGVKEAASIADEFPKIPKRDLPFPISQKNKKARTTNGQEKVDLDESAADAQNSADGQKPRPATSSVDGRTTRKRKPAQQPRRPLASKKTGSKVAQKKHDKAILSFIDDEESKTSHTSPVSSAKHQSIALRPALEQYKSKANVSQSPASTTGGVAPVTDPASTQRSPSPESNEASNACVACRKKRSKCDRALPHCGKCKQEGQSCDYTPPKTRSKPSKGLTNTNQVVLLNNDEAASTAVKTRSFGIQTALISLPMPYQRNKAVQTGPESALRVSEIAAVASITRAVEGVVQTHQEARGDDPDEPTVLNEMKLFSTSLGATKEERDQALEQKICDLLMDDMFIDFCEEVEQVCKKSGIAI